MFQLLMHALVSINRTNTPVSIMKQHLSITYLINQIVDFVDSGPCPHKSLLLFQLCWSNATHCIFDNHICRQCRRRLCLHKGLPLCQLCWRNAFRIAYLIHQIGRQSRQRALPAQGLSARRLKKLIFKKNNQ